MTGIPVHTPANQEPRRADDSSARWPIAERDRPSGGGTRLGEVDRTRRGGGTSTGGEGGGQSSLVYNKRKREGKRKKGPRACERDNETKIRE